MLSYVTNKFETFATFHKLDKIFDKFSIIHGNWIKILIIELFYYIFVRTFSLEQLPLVTSIKILILKISVFSNHSNEFNLVF